jgi:hypothetical protein
MTITEQAMTFDHEAALRGARIYCGNRDVSKELNFSHEEKMWYVYNDGDITWNVNGEPNGGFPPLTTKPNEDANT